ncbi:hypothetical protein NFHSH190041_11910 [Shewanella sp. NFH-SH190041]|uniref:class I SAM-dependent methyltransferase n=1 Tax=Shewanella sp. NFH-SH190041 TaxID=2950245 RepID=UPI0021C4C09C|nr:class I SAM-dependent methyltransferase [Shewanella sp. NFH-SH190041]BDM63739.1 hypothetical protein NFHSH190041_11910 [Shewanella sp. NFH-SH190041]
MTRLLVDAQDSRHSLDKAAVRQFFDIRANKAATLGLDRAVIYQDKHPELAQARDKAEKQRLRPYLALAADDRVLDIGCGTGRWADEVLPQCGTYLGVDICDGFIQLARERFAHCSHACFCQLGAEDVGLLPAGPEEQFQLVLSMGVMIYLNDAELQRYLDGLCRLVAPGGRVIFREPVGLDKKLVLSEHYSAEMGQDYHAIYRTEAELQQYFVASLARCGFRCRASGNMFDDKLNNRQETGQQFYLFVREGA